jgi:hypothetical protein
VKESNSSDSIATWWSPVAGIAPGVFYLRCLRVIAQLAAAYWFADQVSPFFYQQF